MLLCGCSNKLTITTNNYTCTFSSNGTVGTVICHNDEVKFCDISVDCNDVDISVSVTMSQCTVTVGNITEKYNLDSTYPFPLAELGKTLLLAANGHIDDNIVIGNDGFISKVVSSDGTAYTLKSHKVQ